MFSRWNLTRNPFDPSPISLGTLDWFVGREKEVQLCRRLIAQRSVVLVEGGLGVGTTSFGNVVRFRSGPRTPKMELGVYRGWTSQTLLENVLVALLHEITEDPKAARRRSVRKVRSLVERVEQAVHSAGISLLGFGGQISRNVAVTQPGIVPMESLRNGLVTLAEELRPKESGAAFTVQLNNLDPEVTFTEEELVTFLNDVRDCLQLPGFSWLLVGKTGLASFVTRRVPRLRSIVGHDVTLAPLSFDVVQKCVARRINACALPGKKARNPIHPDLLSSIYIACAGSLRETFIICGKLCLAMASDPVYDVITEKEAGALLAELLAVRFAQIDRSPLQRTILRELSRSPGLTQGELIERLGKSQAAISRAARALTNAELIRRSKNGRRVVYWPAAEVRLASERL